MMRTPKSTIPPLEGCICPSLNTGSEQPWRLPVLSSSATWKQNPVTLGLGVTAKVLLFLSPLPLLLLLGYRTW